MATNMHTRYKDNNAQSGESHTVEAIQKHSSFWKKNKSGTKFAKD